MAVAFLLVAEPAVVLIKVLKHVPGPHDRVVLVEVAVRDDDLLQERIYRLTNRRFGGRIRDRLPCHLRGYEYMVQRYDL